MNATTRDGWVPLVTSWFASAGVESMTDFHDLLDRSEPWVHELAAGDERFERLAQAMTAAMVTLELLMLLRGDFTRQFAIRVLDGRAAPAQGPRVTDRQREGRRRSAWAAVRHVRRAADDMCCKLDCAASTARSDDHLNPRLRPVVRAMTAAAFNVDALARMAWGVHQHDVAVETGQRSDWSDGDLEVLGLSDRARHCLEAGGITSVYALFETTEDELLRLPNMRPRTIDEVKDRLVATGFVGPEQRDTFLRHPALVAGSDS